MVFPNSDTSIFCTWCTTSAYYRFSPARLSLIAIIKNAADNGLSVTTVQYNDFIRFTGHLYNAFLEWIAFNGLSQYTIKTNRIMFAYVNTDVSHTGNTTATKMGNIPIPANSMSANSDLIIDIGIGKIGVAALMNFDLYISPVSNDIATAVRVGRFVVALTTLGLRFTRRIGSKGAINLNQVLAPATSNISDYNTFAIASSNVNIDFGANQWVIPVLTLGNASDTGIITDIKVYIDEP